MHYCNRICEKNDFIHKFECQNFSQNSKKFLQNDILILFLHTLIRTKKINDFDAQLFLELDGTYQQNNVKLDASKCIDEISKLMDKSFIQLFDQNELISYFDKMMANKIEIKSSGETIGLGIYLDYAFDDSDKSNIDISFDGLKIIYKRKNFPALSFSELATDCGYLKKAIRIANKFLKSQTVRDLYRAKIKLKTEFLHEKMYQVKIDFVEQIKAKPNDRDFLAWTDRDISNKININQIFEKRLKKISNNLTDSMGQKEEEIIIVFIGLLIIHEFAHLLYRWNGNLYSPDSREAGNSLERKIFDGHTRAIISPKSKWDENSRFLGIAVDSLSKLHELKHLSYTDYIKKIYDNTMPLNKYLSPRFQDKPEEENIRAIKQCAEIEMDENKSIEQSSDKNDIEALNVEKCGT